MTQIVERLNDQYQGRRFFSNWAKSKGVRAMALYEWRLRIAWIVYSFVLVGLWRLSSKIKNQPLKWLSWIVLGLLTGASAFIFFATCLGIGYAGCM
jgi:hypothetical protein